MAVFSILNVKDMLWEDTYYLTDLPMIEKSIRRMLALLKIAFAGHCDSGQCIFSAMCQLIYMHMPDFCFPKFHNIIHSALQIRLHGALWSSDSARCV